MSATVTVEIGSNLWNARLYAGVALAYELTAFLDEAGTLGLPEADAHLNRVLDRLNRSLEGMMTTIDEAIERQASTGPPQNHTNEEFRLMRDSVLRLHALCSGFVLAQNGDSGNAGRQKKLTRLDKSKERLLDLADWLDAMSTPEETDAKFIALERDLANGDVVPWPALQ